MNIRINGAIFVLATVSALAACASTSPTSPTAPTAMNASAPAATAAKPASPAAPASTAATVKKEDLGGYKHVTRNGKELFCKRENFTGSRTQLVETCLTQAQMTAQRENGQSLLRSVQDRAGDPPQPDSNGSYPTLGSPVMPR